MSATGIQAFLEVLAGAGVRSIFGNPGTTELPLNDAVLVDDRFDYILGLHEVPVVSMADGYALAARQVGVANVHISCGLGNAMGMLYNAIREGSPLLITAGQQDRRLIFEEPILAGDLVSITRPWTKWSVEVNRVEDLPVAVRRAVQTALTPPTGPVFLSIPLDIQTEVSDSLDVSAPHLPNRHVRPPLDALRRAADVLAASKNPCVLAGSRVTEADAVDELVRFAEMLGTPVIAESGTTHGRCVFPTDHPLRAPALPLWSPEVRERLADFDVALVVGMDLLRQYIYHEPSRAIPEHLRLIHLDEDPWQLGKNYPVEVGLIGDSKAGLAELHDLVRMRLTLDAAAATSERAERHAAAHAAVFEQLHQEIVSQHEIRPMTPLVFMDALARVLPDNVSVVEEAVTTTNAMFERLGALKNTSGYLGHRGWALGWAMGAALGAKLAWPERPVLAVIGDGAFMYGVQSLWTAARYRIPVTYVVPNNAQYQILKVCAQQLDLPQAARDRFESLDVVDPEIDFVGLARSLGVRACRVSDPDELSDRVRASLADDRPLVIDVPITRNHSGKLNYG